MPRFIPRTFCTWILCVFLTGCGLKINAPEIELTNDGSDGSGDSGGPGSGATSFELFLGIQGDNGTSRVLKLGYNSQTDALTYGSELSVTASVGAPWGDGLRALSFLLDGSIVTGGGAASWTRIDGTSMALHSTPTVPLSAGTDVHGMCTLPNGNVIAGGYRATIHEYDSTGTAVRTFKAGPTYFISDCAAISNTRVFWVDYDGDTDQNGDVVLSEYSAGSWTETARYVTNNQLPGLSASDFYSIVGHSNGYVYAFPQALGGSRNRQVLRCGASGNLSDCALIGSDLRLADATLDGIQAARQIPGQDDILFVDSINFKVFRFHVADSTVTALADLNSLGLTNAAYVRNMIIR